MGRIFVDKDAEDIINAELNEMVLEGRTSATHSDVIRMLHAQAEVARGRPRPKP